jgi:membrane associated rhomboid family serine protease
MATVFSNIERFFKQKSVLSTLLIINLLVFLLMKVVGVCFLLFNTSPVHLIAFFELPASLAQLMHRPWTLISYMFTHLGFWHIVFNLLWLYWFGQIFLRFFGPKQLGGLYVLGGIVGGLLFVLSYNLFPYFRESVDYSYLIGASASVMAIVFATAFYKKEYEINLLFLGNIKLIYIAGFFFILDLISIESDNPGGHIAHIGGALMGIWFANAFLKGRDLTSGINFVIDKIVNLFTKRERKPSFTKIYGRPETDYEYNQRKNNQNNEIDRILDKIKRSGYNSLSENEKKTLFNASK